MEDLGDRLTKGPLLGNSGWQCVCVCVRGLHYSDMWSLRNQKSCCQVETKSGNRDYCQKHCASASGPSPKKVGTIIR